MPQLADSVQLNDDTPRCPNCGKRVSAQVTVCPACGYELLPHRTRIRCKRCGSRIPADTQECPHCHGDPRVGRVPPIAIRVGAIVVGMLLLCCVGWVVFRAITTNTVARMLGLNQSTPVPTIIVQIIYVVASPPPPTPQATATQTATPTSRFSPTPTRRGVRATPSVPAATALPPGFYPTPQLLAPANTTVYTGADANILLEWLPVAASGLRENEWYLISLSFTARDGSPGERKSFLKETHWTVPPAWRNDLSADARAVKWNITVVRVEGIDPFASPNRTPVSLPSATRSFIWH